MNILEAIKERRSVRSFDGKALSEAVRNELLAFAAGVYNPFGGHFSIRLKSFNLKNGYKPNTYGIIKDANDFFLIGMADEEATALATGFCFEQVVLKAWQLGLGTCWIAATFKGTDFDNGESWPDGETLKIICPVGQAAKKSLMERITRFSLGSRNRKPFSDLFFTDSFKQPLSPNSSFGEALEMLRLAPSSTNSQPWRVLTDNDTVHFYYLPKSRLSVLDTGIGICHFYETEKYYGHTGAFYTLSTPPAVHDKWKYLVSYRRRNTNI